MASSSSRKIKSAIGAKGRAERQLTSDYFDISTHLIDAQESAELFKIDRAESDTLYELGFSALELSDTLAQSFEEQSKIKSDIAAFETSLPEGVAPLRVEKKPSLMDVINPWSKQKATLSDYLYGQNEYFVGERSFGSKYDVAARGKHIKSLDLVDDLTKEFSGSKRTSYTPPETLDIPEGFEFDIKKLYSMVGKGLDTNKSPVIPSLEYNLGDFDFESDEESPTYFMDK